MEDTQLTELKQRFMQQYGITEEQLGKMVDAVMQLWELAKEAAQKISEALKEAAKSIETSGLAEVLKNIAADYKDGLDELALWEYRESSRCYDRTDTRNGFYSAKLKSYKNKITSAAIRRPRRTARSCC